MRGVQSMRGKELWAVLRPGEPRWLGGVPAEMVESKLPKQNRWPRVPEAAGAQRLRGDM